MQEKFYQQLLRKESIYFARSHNKSSIKRFATYTKLLHMEIFQRTTRAKSKLLPKFHNFQSIKTVEKKLNNLKHKTKSTRGTTDI